MDRIEQTYIIDAPPELVWQALTDPELISQWSGAQAEFNAEPGAEYKLWNGDIAGSVVEVVPVNRLVQTWKPNNWTVEDSIVTFTLSPSDSGTRVDLIHENVQDWDYAGTSEGWDIYYLGVIKKMLESQKPAAKKPATKKAAAKKAAGKKKSGAKKQAASSKKTTARKSAAKKKTTRRR